MYPKCASVFKWTLVIHHEENGCFQRGRARHNKTAHSLSGWDDLTCCGTIYFQHSFYEHLLVFTCTPGNSYCGQVRSVLLCPLSCVWHLLSDINFLSLPIHCLGEPQRTACLSQLLDCKCKSLTNKRSEGEETRYYIAGIFIWFTNLENFQLWYSDFWKLSALTYWLLKTFNFDIVTSENFQLWHSDFWKLSALT